MYVLVFQMQSIFSTNFSNNFLQEFGLIVECLHNYSKNVVQYFIRSDYVGQSCRVWFKFLRICSNLN